MKHGVQTNKKISQINEQSLQSAEDSQYTVTPYFNVLHSIISTDKYDTDTDSLSSVCIGVILICRYDAV